MFCDKCGKENPDNVQFCAGCGAALNAAPANTAPEAETKDNTNSEKKFSFAKIIKIAVPVVIAVLAIFLVVNLFGGSAYEKTIENYLNALADGNGKAYQKAIADPYYIEWLTSKDGPHIDEDLLGYYFRSSAESSMDNLAEAFGKNVRYSISVDYVTKFDDGEVKDIADYLEEEYEYEKDDVKDVVIVEYVGKVKGSDVSRTIKTGEKVLVKVKGKWYVSTLLDRSNINSILD